VTASDPGVELLQFPYSHFNEKARWALDWKRVPHRRTHLLPGPHAGTVRKRTGQTMVPVVRLGEEHVPGSARIIDELERRYPEPPLYPKDPDLRRRALEIQERFDEGFGPRIRQALFSVMIDEPGYVCRMFASPHPWHVRAFYRAIFPIGRIQIRRAYNFDDPEEIPRAHAATRAALDFVATEAGPTGTLAGDEFSVADLAAAALLAPVANPPDSPMARPEPMPESLRRWTQQWQDHPGVAWVHTSYRSHRPRSAEIGA